MLSLHLQQRFISDFDYAGGAPFRRPSSELPEIEVIAHFECARRARASPFSTPSLIATIARQNAYAITALRGPPLKCVSPPLFISRRVNTEKFILQHLTALELYFSISCVSRFAGCYRARDALILSRCGEQLMQERRRTTGAAVVDIGAAEFLFDERLMMRCCSCCCSRFVPPSFRLLPSVLSALAKLAQWLYAGHLATL